MNLVIIGLAIDLKIVASPKPQAPSPKPQAPRLQEHLVRRVLRLTLVGIAEPDEELILAENRLPTVRQAGPPRLPGTRCLSWSVTSSVAVSWSAVLVLMVIRSAVWLAVPSEHPDASQALLALHLATALICGLTAWTTWRPNARLQAKLQHLATRRSRF